MTKLLILAAPAALAALATMPVGQPAMAQGANANPSVVVRHADLDLRSEAGVRTLNHRLRHAASKVCGTASDFDLKGKNDMRACRRETLATATAQARIVIADASRSQPIRVSSIAR